MTTPEQVARRACRYWEQRFPGIHPVEGCGQCEAIATTIREAVAEARLTSVAPEVWQDERRRLVDALAAERARSAKLAEALEEIRAITITGPVADRCAWAIADYEKGAQ